jgi:hypothetical protein
MPNDQFDFVTPDDMKDLREAYNRALKDHAESYAWARITLSRSDFLRDFAEIE